MTSRHRAFPLFPILILAATLGAQAQLTLSIQNIDAATFPTLSLRVVARQGQYLRKDFDSTNCTVREDGFNQSPLHVRGTRGTTSFSIEMVIAAGACMSASDVQSAKGVATNIVDSLDNLNDELGGYLYAGGPTSFLDLQASKSIILNQFGLIVAGTGPCNLWDGVYAGVMNILGNSSNPARAVFVMSNGHDDGSAHNIKEIAAAARLGHIQIYTLGINTGGSDGNLKALADSTGGLFFTDPILAVQVIVNTLRGTPDYFFVDYATNYRCKDGLPRMINLKIKAGNDSAQVSAADTLAADPSTNVPALIRVDTGSVTSGKTAGIGVFMDTPVTNQRFNGCTIDLAFDASKLTLDSAVVDAAFLPGVGVTFTPKPSGATLTMTGAAELAGKGKLMRLVFTGAVVTQNAMVPVTINSLVFSQGCIVPQLQSGSMRVLPRNYGLTGSSKPYSFVWNETTKDYDPPEATLSVDVTNSGDLSVSGLKATLPSSTDYKLVHGSSAIAPFVPPTLLPGQKATARWSVKAVPRADELGKQIDIPITSTEGATATSKVFINIKAATSAAVATCSVDAVSIDKGVYKPNPAMVTAVVKSAGTATSPAGQIAITLPTDVTLASGPATQNFAALATGTTQTLSWPVTYRTDLPSATSYDLVLVMSGTGGPNDTSVVRLTVPVASGASVTTSCLVNAATVAYDSVAKAWPQFPVTADIENKGLGTSDSLSAELSLPGGLLHKTGGALRIVKVNPLAGGGKANVQWDVTVSDVVCKDRTSQMTYTLREGDSVVYTCTSPVTVLKRPNLAPEVTASTPALIDSTSAGANQSFTVTAKDANADAITYRWQLDGAPVGANQNSFSQTFAQPGTYSIRCVMSDPCGDSAITTWSFKVHALTNVAPPWMAAGFELRGNHPNPFADETAIEFTLPEGEHTVTIDLLDASGRVVVAGATMRMAGGAGEFVMRTGALPSGVYFARLRSGAVSITRPLLLSR